MSSSSVSSASVGKRDLAIDFLRGICFPVMMVDHLRNHWLNLFLFRALGFFCAATVFVFLSGFVAGRVYSRHLIDHNRSSLFRRCWRRAGLIYAIHILISAVTILAIQLSPDLVNTFGREVEFPASAPWEAMFSAFLLLPCGPLLDILPMYVFFLLITPWILLLFSKGKHLWVGLASVAFWILSQFDLSLPLPPFSGVFDTSAWQLLFIGALYLGFRQTSHPIEKPLEPKVINLAVFGTMLALFMLRHSEIFSLQRYADHIPAWWIDKIHLGPLTLLNLALWVIFLWLVPEPLEKLTKQGRTFIALGQNSLAVFAWHTILFYIFMSVFPQLNSFSILGQALVVCFSVACLLFPISLSARRFVRDSDLPSRPHIDNILAIFQAAF